MVQRMASEASMDTAEMLSFEVREIKILQAWTTKSTVGWMIQPFALRIVNKHGPLPALIYLKDLIGR